MAYITALPQHPVHNGSAGLPTVNSATLLSPIDDSRSLTSSRASLADKRSSQVSVNAATESQSKVSRATSLSRDKSTRSRAKSEAESKSRNEPAKLIKNRGQTEIKSTEPRGVSRNGNGRMRNGNGLASGPEMGDEEFVRPVTAGSTRTTGTTKTTNTMKTTGTTKSTATAKGQPPMPVSDKKGAGGGSIRKRLSTLGLGRKPSRGRLLDGVEQHEIVPEE